MKKHLKYAIFIVLLLLINVNIFAEEKSDADYDLSDYFGTMKACTKDGSENDCKNGNEYKFYLKMYDIYFLYKNKYNVKLDLPLIMATLYYNNEQLPTVFESNLNTYNRNAVKDTSQVTNLDWEYDYKNESCYVYLNSEDNSYDMQILAKNMVTKKITYKCSDGSSKEAKDIETSNYSEDTLKCDSGKYNPDSVNATYELDTNKYNKFLLEYVKLKYHTKGDSSKTCKGISGTPNGSYVDGVTFVTGSFGKIYYYNQGDYTTPGSYGGYGSIATHGCGPTALSIAISSLLNEPHNPVELTNYVCSIGGCTDGGTVWDAITKTPEHYGLKATRTTDTQKVINALGTKKAIVIVIMCPGHFTTSGHFITLTGVSENGMVTVADPASRDRSKNWDFNTVAEETCGAYWIINR